jgi:hypothetical protein
VLQVWQACIKKLSLTYLEGTSKSQNLGVAFYRGLSRQAIYTSMGTLQSLLAQSARPPKKKNPALRGLIWFSASCFLALIFHSMPATIFIFLIATFGAALHIKDAIDYNDTEWPKKYQTWDKSFLCKQCGTVTFSGILPDERLVE